MSKSDAGKGDTERPRQISKKEWEENHERTFGKSQKAIEEHNHLRAIQSETE